MPNLNWTESKGVEIPPAHRNSMAVDASDYLLSLAQAGNAAEYTYQRTGDAFVIATRTRFGDQEIIEVWDTKLVRVAQVEVPVTATNPASPPVRSCSPKLRKPREPKKESATKRRFKGLAKYLKK